MRSVISAPRLFRLLGRRERRQPDLLELLASSAACPGRRAAATRSCRPRARRARRGPGPAGRRRRARRARRGRRSRSRGRPRRYPRRVSRSTSAGQRDLRPAREVQERAPRTAPGPAAARRASAPAAPPRPSRGRLPRSAVSSANSSRRALSDAGMRWYGVSVGAGAWKTRAMPARGEIADEALGLLLVRDDDASGRPRSRASAASRIAGRAPTPPETTRRSSPPRTLSRRSAYEGRPRARSVSTGLCRGGESIGRRTPRGVSRAASPCTPGAGGRGWPGSERGIAGSGARTPRTCPGVELLRR